MSPARPLPTLQVIQEELGRPVHEVFSEITPEPVAAASLGQVRTKPHAPAAAGRWAPHG